MASTSSHNVIHDDEEFDWEAAVREIDFACLATKPSTSDPIDHFPHRVPNKLLSERGCKQSTLDKFIGKSAPQGNKNEGKQEEGLSGVIDPEAAKTWIYPVNIPLRDYQLSMTRTALFSNTLVALPTGLGKTLIAAVVMYNYFRWFPEGKIIFAAPSRPLVLQQIQACHNIVGIPQDWTIDMTGHISPTTRMHLWKAKRVFFVTPQVLDNDIRSGIFMVKRLVCLVIDEAHRASGNHSYCVAVRELMDVPVQFRILALTATPGSKQQTIQQVIDNLQISTLEYRNESDPDVRPYVQDRKVELIEVDMGQDAMEINNMLMEVARPFVARLMVMGVLPNRDFKTLSPCDLLNARDRFRQAPPLDLPSLKYGEVEGYLGVLITFNHILKLLSSHGIRPAYEMLEDKLRQGAFARFMSRNEGLVKAKLLMQQSLSHGAPSPKLLKMLEVLIDHFKAKDPQNSRVIIFSNFRGSVRDIMNALSGIGEYVKATQFIGQSSAKTLKGQSQKVQQAVLQKFRDGRYNVIVATSIGEEGLDIMEVDLVICFDANISPLRMIQRMGRTGRKNKGRVVVLACKGTELNGYKRKQANNNTVNKHLRNGGSDSFNFHASPRMIPHIFKPEVKLVELSIEQFVPRGRKMRDDCRSETPAYKTKLTDAEFDLIAKYFEPFNGNDAWRPSLIAFPHFQAFPSRVHRVMHSIRTGMLMDAMQSLQDLTFIKESEASIREDEQVSCLSLGVKAALQQENSMTDSWISHNSLEECEKASDSNPLDMENSRCYGQNPPTHCCLFGSDFVSVDSAGRVMVSSVPLLPLKEISQTTCLKEDFNPKFQLRDYDETPRAKDIFDLITASPERSTKTKNDVGLLLGDEYRSDDFKDVKLSPRLCNFIQSGVVPESPICCDGTSEEGRGNSTGADPGLSGQLNTEASMKSFPVPSQKDDESESKIHFPDSWKSPPIPSQKDDESESKIHLPASFVNEEIQTPVLKSNIKRGAARASVVVSQLIEQVQAPTPAVLEDSSSNGCSREWCLSSGDLSASFQPERKWKRLRKYGDQQRVGPLEGEGNTNGPKLNKTRAHENGIGKRKRQKDGARAYIEEEAVVSEVEVSDDEEEMHEMNHSHEDSFIDDRINPTTGSTQEGTSACDMMAIYRRSLLSQSPMGGLSNGSTGHSPNPVASYSRGDPVTPSVMMTNQSLHRPPDEQEIEENEKISSKSVPCRESGIHNGSRNEFGKWKRKFNSYEAPVVNLEEQFSCLSKTIARAVIPCDQVAQEQRIEANGAGFNGGDDDEFYEGLDLDAVEEEAAKLLEQNLESSVLNGIVAYNPNTQQLGLKGSPSFDLGI